VGHRPAAAGAQVKPEERPPVGESHVGRAVGPADVAKAPAGRSAVPAEPQLTLLGQIQDSAPPAVRRGPETGPAAELPGLPAAVIGDLAHDVPVACEVTDRAARQRRASARFAGRRLA
jgi:hypothetical protein